MRRGETRIARSSRMVDARCMEWTQTPLSGTETVVIGLVVCIVVIPSATWGLVQHFQVMAHEGMHWVVQAALLARSKRASAHE